MIYLMINSIRDHGHCHKKYRPSPNPHMPISQATTSPPSPLKLLAAPTNGIGEEGRDRLPVGDAKPVDATERTVPLTVGNATGCAVGVTVLLPTTISGAEAEGRIMLELAAGLAVARADSYRKVTGQRWMARWGVGWEVHTNATLRLRLSVEATDKPPAFVEVVVAVVF